MTLMTRIRLTMITLLTAMAFALGGMSIAHAGEGDKEYEEDRDAEFEETGTGAGGEGVEGGAAPDEPAQPGTPEDQTMEEDMEEDPWAEDEEDEDEDPWAEDPDDMERDTGTVE